MKLMATGSGELSGALFGILLARGVSHSFAWGASFAINGSGDAMGASWIGSDNAGEGDCLIIILGSTILSFMV